MANLEPITGQFKEPDITDALKALDPEASFAVRGDQVYTNVDWLGSNAKPSESAATAKLAELKTAYDAKDYSRKRYGSYKTIVEQLDMLYKDMIAGKLDATGTWAAHIAAVKGANPKP